MPGALGSVEARDWRQFIAGQFDPRRDLAHYLAGEFAAGYPIRLTTWRADAVGQQLSDREVSRLEVLSALSRLPYRRRRIVELLYVDDRPWREVARRLHISETTLARERAAALQAMIAIIYDSA